MAWMRKGLLITVALLLLLPIAAIAVLVYTPLGVSLAASQLGRLEKIGIRIEGVSGTFSGPLRVERFELTHPRVHIVAHDIFMDPQLRGLLIQTIIRCRNCAVRCTPVRHNPTFKAPIFFQHLI